MRWRRGPWVIAVFVLGLGACGGSSSSSVSGAGGSFAGDDASASDARAGDVPSGTGGSGGASGSGGAPNADSGSGADSAPTTATDVCRAAIRTICQRLLACTGEDMLTCMQAAALCPTYYFNADSNRTVQGITACLPAIAAMTCTDVKLGLFPSCLAAGNRADGAGCAFSSQCRSNTCSSGQACSTCRAGVVGVLGANVAHAALGQPCNLGANPVMGCAGDLICTDGTCVAPPGDGQPCINAGFSVCAAGTTCTSPVGGGTCTVPGACGAGVVCNADSYCKTGDGGSTCAPRAGLGQACGDPAAGASPCDGMAYCNGKCFLPRQSGDACDDNNPCDYLLNCVNGTCQALSITDCP